MSFRNHVAMTVLVLTALAQRALAEDAPAPVSFSRDVAPILLGKCQACHAAPEPKGGYQVGNYQATLKAGESESASITPGKPDESYLLELISSTDPDARMPKDADPLSAEQVALIKRWISEGAKYDGTDPTAPLALIVPKTAQPGPPESYKRPVPVTALAFNADGQELAASGYHEVTIWNASTGALVRRIKNVPERVQSLAYSPDGALLAVAGGTPGQFGEVKLFNPATGALVKDLGSMADIAFRAVFNPAGTKLAVGGADRSIRVYDVASGKQEILIEDHADWVINLAWNPDGSRIVSGSRDKTSKLFNAANGESLMTYSGQGEQVYGVGFSADGKLIYTAGGDKKVHAWNPDDGQKKGEFAGFGREVLGLTTYQDKIFTCSGDKTVQQHRADLKQFKTYPGHTDAVFTVAFHPGTGRVAAGSFNGEVRVWNSEDATPITTFVAAPGYSPSAPAAAAGK